MSVNITVNGKFAKHCGKSSLLEDPERKKKELLEDRKKQRILQVRAKSKNIAQKIRSDVAKQRERLQKNFDQQCAQEQERLQRQAIAQAHHDYRCAIFQVGSAHRAACMENQQKATKSSTASKKQTYEEFKRQQAQKGQVRNNENLAGMRSCIKTAQKDPASTSASKEKKTTKINIQQTQPRCNCCPCDNDEGECSSDLFEDSCEISCTESVSDEESECIDETEIPAPLKQPTQTKGTKLCKTPAVILDVDVGLNDVVTIMSPTEIRDSYTENNRQFSHVIRVSPERQHGDKNNTKKCGKTNPSSKLPSDPTSSSTSCEATNSADQNRMPSSRKPRFTQISDLIEKKSQYSKPDKPASKSPRRQTGYYPAKSPSKKTPPAPPPSPYKERSPVRPSSPTKQQPAPKSPTRKPMAKNPASSSPKRKPTPKSPGPSSPIRKPAPKSPISKSPTRKPTSKSPGPSSPIRKPAPKSPISTSPTRKPSQKSSSSSSLICKQVSQPPAPKSSSKSKKCMCNKNCDLALRKCPENLSNQNQCSIGTLGTETNSASGYSCVQFYDYNNKYSKSYPQPVTAVHILPPDRAQPNAMDQACIERQLQNTRQQEIERIRQKCEERGQKALEREQVRRDCNELTEKLEALTKQHAPTISTDANVVFGTTNACKETKMNAALEEILMRPAIITCPEITRPAAQQPCKTPASYRTQQPDASSLNLGAPPKTAIEMDNSIPSSESCRSILLGYVNDQSKQIKNDLNQYDANPQQHQQKTTRLKCLLKRINKLRDALLYELQAGDTQNEPENIQLLIDSLCDLRQERESIIIGDMGESNGSAPPPKKNNDKNLKQSDTNSKTKQRKGSKSKEPKQNKSEESSNKQLQEREKLLQEKEAILESKLLEFFELQKNCNEDIAKQSTNTEADARKTTVMVGDKPLEIVVNVKCGNSKKSKLQAAKTPRRESKIIQCPNSIKKKKSNTNIAKQKQMAIQSSSSYDSHSTSYRSLPKNLKDNEEGRAQCVFSSQNNEQQPPKESANPESGKQTTRPPANVNPLLAQYIQRLLGMSRNSVQALEVSSSDIETPCSSVIKTVFNQSDTSDSERLSTEHLERVQQFIDDNYSFVKELEDSLKSTTVKCLEDCINESLDKIWKQRFCKIERQIKPRFEAAKDDENKRAKKADLSAGRKESVCGENRTQIDYNNTDKAQKSTESNKQDKSQTQKIECDARQKQIEDLCQRLINLTQTDCFDTEKISKNPKSSDTFRPEKSQTRDEYCEEKLAKQIASFIQSLVAPTQRECEDTANTSNAHKCTDMIINDKSQRGSVKAQKSTESKNHDKSQTQKIECDARQKQIQDLCQSLINLTQTDCFDTKRISKDQKSSDTSRPEKSQTRDEYCEEKLTKQIASFIQSLMTPTQRKCEDTANTSKVQKYTDKSQRGSVESTGKTYERKADKSNVDQSSCEKLIKQATLCSKVQTDAKRLSGTQKCLRIDKSSSIERRSITPPQQNCRDFLQVCRNKAQDSENVQKASNPEIITETTTSVTVEQQTSTRLCDKAVVTDHSHHADGDLQIQHYAQLTENCNHRISELTDLITKVREEKQKILENTLSSVSDTERHSSEGNDIHKLVEQQRQDQPSTSKSLKRNMLFETQPVSSNEVSLVENLPLEKYKSTSGSRDSGISLSRPVTAQGLNSDMEPQSAASSKTGQRPKPPSCINRYNPQLLEDNVARELSTILELDTPGTSRVTMAVGTSHSHRSTASEPAVKPTALLPSCSEYAKMLNLDLSKVNSEERIRIQKEYELLRETVNEASKTCEQPNVNFPRFEEYANMLNLNLTTGEPFPAFEEYSKQSNLNQTALIREKYKELFEAYIKAKATGGADKAVFPTFEEYAKMLDLDLTIMDPEECKRIQEEYKSVISNLNESKALKAVQSFPTFEQYAKQICVDPNMLDPNQTALIREEYKELFEAYIKDKVTGGTDTVAFPLFEEYAKLLNLNLTIMDPEEKKRILKEYKLIKEDLKEANAAKAADPFPTFEQYTKELSLNLSKLDPNQTALIREEYKEFFEAYIIAKASGTEAVAFPTFEEYAKMLNLNLTIMDSEESARVQEEYNSLNNALNEIKALKLAIQAFPTFEEYANKLNCDITKMNPKEISLIREQHRELFQAYVKAKTKRGCFLPVPIMTFEEYAKKMSLNLTQEDPEQVACIEQEYNELLAAITEVEDKLRIPSTQVSNLGTSDISPVAIDGLIEHLQSASMLIKSKKLVANNTPRESESLENCSSTPSSDSESILQIEKELRRRNIIRGSFIVPIEQDNVYCSTANNVNQSATAFQRMLLAESGLERISTSDSRSNDFERELLNVCMPSLVLNKRKETDVLSTSTTTSSSVNIKSASVKIPFSHSKHQRCQQKQQSPTEKQPKPHISDESNEEDNKKLNLRSFLTKELQKHASSSSSSTGSSVDKVLKRQFFQSIIGSISPSPNNSPRPCNRKTIERQKTSTPNTTDSQNASSSSQLFSGESRLSSVRFQKQTTTHYYPKAKESDISVNAEDYKDADVNGKTKQFDKSKRYIPKPKINSRKNLGDDDDDYSNDQPSTSAQMQYFP